MFYWFFYRLWLQGGMSWSAIEYSTSSVISQTCSKKLKESSLQNQVCVFQSYPENKAEIWCWEQSMAKAPMFSYSLLLSLCLLWWSSGVMDKFVCPFPGVKWYQELQLRLFCRQVLLDPWPNQPECHFWLMQLLKPWPLVSQAHLLFILYGPLLPEGEITYYWNINAVG